MTWPRDIQADVTDAILGNRHRPAVDGTAPLCLCGHAYERHRQVPPFACNLHSCGCMTYQAIQPQTQPRA